MYTFRNEEVPRKQKWKLQPNARSKRKNLRVQIFIKTNFRYYNSQAKLKSECESKPEKK